MDTIDYCGVLPAIGAHCKPGGNVVSSSVQDPTRLITHR